MYSQDVTYEEIASILRIPLRFRQEKHVASLMKLTEHVQFFKKISEDYHSAEVHKSCCETFSLEEYSENDVIINFGEIGEKFYIILKGSVSVKIPVKEKLKLTKEEASHYEGLEIEEEESSSESSEDIDAIVLPTRKDRREGIPVASVSEIIKNLQRERKSLLKREEIRDPNKIVDEEVAIARLFRDKFKRENKEIVKVVREADNEFIEIEVNKLDEVNVLKEGDGFGELALISDRPRAATVVARERVSLLVIQKYQFKRILGNISSRRVMTKIRFLQSLPYFSSWSQSAITKISLYFNQLNFQRNQYMFIEGQEAKEIFFIREGEFLITKQHKINTCPTPTSMQSAPSPNVGLNKGRKLASKSTSLKLCLKGKSESFGGYELLNGLNTRQFSSICYSASAEVYSIQREHFFNRIPMIEAIKEFISDENARLWDRYSELCENLIDDDVIFKLSPIKETSQIKSATKLSKKVDFYNTITRMHSTSHRRQMVIKDRIFERKLTLSEIQRAVNGRNLKIEQRPRLLHSPVKKAIPPPNFMLKTREVLKAGWDMIKKLENV
jgi:CRP-like cAMP-binding protein